jgi:hypothetical protein
VKSFVWKATGLLAFVVLALGTAATAHASHLNVRVVEPTPAIAGQASALAAIVTSADTGQAVAGVDVTFFAHGSFGKISGDMEIGRAVTDSDGVATISYTPRESGTHDIRVGYAPVSGGTAEQTTGSIAVEGSPDQLYVQTAGIQVPGLNSWLIIGLLTVVWGILFFVAVAVIRIARAGAGDVVPAQRPSLATAMASSRNLDSGGTRSGR